MLVLDDPFGNLDPCERLAVERLVGDMHIGGRTAIAAIDDARVPDCFTHLAVLSEGRLVHRGPADFAAFSAGRQWRYRLRCAGQAEAAIGVVGRLADRLEASDADTLDCTLTGGQASAQPPIARIIEALVRAGISVEAAGLHPHWTIQLLDATA